MASLPMPSPRVVKAAATWLVMWIMFIGMALSKAHGETSWGRVSVSTSLSETATPAEQALRGAVNLTHVKDDTNTELSSNNNNTLEQIYYAYLVAVYFGWFLGPMIYLGCISLLWRNEGHAVRIDQLLQFAKRKVKTVPPAPANKDNLRELVFVTGESRTSTALQLTDWGNFKAPAGSAKISAQTYMCQWVENDGRYTKQWFSQKVDSSNFKDKDKANPEFPVKAKCRGIAQVTVGDFVLPLRMLGQLQKWQACEVTSDMCQQFESIPQLKGYKCSQKKGSDIPNGPVKGKDVVYLTKAVDGPAEPCVGDLVVILEHVLCPATVSLLGVQVPKDSLAPAAWTFVPLEYMPKGRSLRSQATVETTNLGDELHKSLLGEHEEDKYHEEEAFNASQHASKGWKAFWKNVAVPCSAGDAFFQKVGTAVILCSDKAMTASECLSEFVKYERRLHWKVRVSGFFYMWFGLEILAISLSHFVGMVTDCFTYSALVFFCDYDLMFIGYMIMLGFHGLALGMSVMTSVCVMFTSWSTHRPLYALTGLGIFLTFGVVLPHLAAHKP